MRGGNLNKVLDTSTNDGDDALVDHGPRDRRQKMIRDGMKFRAPSSIPATVWALLGFTAGLVGIFEIAGF